MNGFYWRACNREFLFTTVQWESVPFQFYIYTYTYTYTHKYIYTSINNPSWLGIEYIYTHILWQEFSIIFFFATGGFFFDLFYNFFDSSKARFKGFQFFDIILILFKFFLFLTKLYTCIYILHHIPIVSYFIQML